MKLIAVNGNDIEAWADEPFDPLTDDVELRQPGKPPKRVRWQQALKFGFWTEPPE